METVLRFAPKQKRASHPKHRTGCVTCKQRRVKCDETKPICKTCSRGDRKCEYRAPAPITRRRVNVESGNEPSSRTGASAGLRPIYPRLALPLTPSTSFAGSEKEKNFFQLYRDRVAHDLGGVFEMPFFAVVVLRECHTSPPIRHLVLAFGGFSKAASSSDGEKDENMRFALFHLCKALHSLRNVLTQGSNQIRLAVIASVLLSCYEGLQGNYETSKQQISSGSDLLQEWQLIKGTSVNGTIVPSLVDEELPIVFPRLELGLIGYSAVNSAVEQYPIRDEPIELNNSPRPLENLFSAQLSVIRLIYRALQFMRKVDEWKRKEWPQNFPSSVWRESVLILETIHRWTIAFAPLTSSPAAQESPEVLTFFVGLGMCRLFHATGLKMDELIHDKFLCEYQRFARDSRTAVSKEFEGRTYIKMQSILAMAMPIFYTATRCRDPVVRREAVAIFRDYPMRQGVWNSQHLLPLCEWFINIEEEGMDSNGFIPENSRGRLHTLRWTMQDDGLHVEVMQGGVDGNWVLRKNILQIKQ